MSFELPETIYVHVATESVHRSLLTSLGRKERESAVRTAALPQPFPEPERYCQSPGLRGPRWDRAGENGPLLPGPEGSYEGTWLLSLESERSLLNSLDFPSQPSRERVRLGNVSSEQVL